MPLSVARRVGSLSSLDEINTYFASDPMVAKVRTVAEELRKLGAKEYDEPPPEMFAFGDLPEVDKSFQRYARIGKNIQPSPTIYILGMRNQSSS